MEKSFENWGRKMVAGYPKISKVLKKLKQIYGAWAVMTKHKTASLYLHLAAIYSHLLPRFSKLLTGFVETRFLN